MPRLSLRLCCCSLLLASSGALALDKQGSAHGGSASAGEATGFNLAGAFQLGVSLFNPSYAARPDNTGLALLRYGLHLDLDLLGPKLSIPLDVNFFSDAQLWPREAALLPSEFDVIAGVTSTWDVAKGALELGVRAEHDRPVDRPGFSQTYVDARARYLYSLAAYLPKLGDALHHGDVSGWLTLGGFALNPTYAARPDNSGLALLRYALHSEVSVEDDRVSLGFDFTFFSDRQAKNPIAPSELDFTVDLILHEAPYELHLAYERDMPVDRPGLVQHFVYALFVVAFDLRDARPPASTHKQPIVSP